MPLYRAVPKENFDSTKPIEVRPTRRLPSNVPYLIDNIWEFLRPTYAPSRRHAIYASPTPELALANASAVGAEPAKYVVCELEDIPANVRMAHLRVSDARYHDDVGMLMRRVVMRLGSGYGSLPVMQKLVHAPLFMPVTSQEELRDYFVSTTETRALVEELRELSTFWEDAAPCAQNHQGELFFELAPFTTYFLRPIA